MPPLKPITVLQSAPTCPHHAPTNLLRMIRNDWPLKHRAVKNVLRWLLNASVWLDVCLWICSALLVLPPFFVDRIMISVVSPCKMKSLMKLAPLYHACWRFGRYWCPFQSFFALACEGVDLHTCSTEAQKSALAWLCLGRGVTWA